MNSNDDSSFASSSLFRITKQQSISKFHILARRARFGKTCKGAWWMPELISPSSSGSWPLFPLRTLRTGIGIENGTHNSKQVSQLSSVSKRLVLWESYESSFNLVILVFYVFFEAWLVLTLVFFGLPSEFTRKDVTDAQLLEPLGESFYTRPGSVQYVPRPIPG